MRTRFQHFLPWAIVVATFVALLPPAAYAQLNRVGWSQIFGTRTTSVPVAINGIAAVSTDGVTISNTTPATVGTTVQMSPRQCWSGTAYNSSSTLSEPDKFCAEVLPVTNAGATTAQWNLSSSINGGALVNMLSILSGGAVTFAGNLTVPGSAGLAMSGRAAMIATASKLIQLEDAGVSTGMEVNVGSATLGTCTAGTIVTGSHNFAGGYTGNTSSSCVINFGAPNFTNTPFCFAMSTASTTHPRISAASASSITITGGVSGEAINYHCDGRIGT